MIHMGMMNLLSHQDKIIKEMQMIIIQIMEMINSTSSPFHLEEIQIEEEEEVDSGFLFSLSLSKMQRKSFAHFLGKNRNNSNLLVFKMRGKVFIKVIIICFGFK